VISCVRGDRSFEVSRYAEETAQLRQGIKIRNQPIFERSIFYNHGDVVVPQLRERLFYLSSKRGRAFITIFSVDEHDDEVSASVPLNIHLFNGRSGNPARRATRMHLGVYWFQPLHTLNLDALRQ